MTLDDFKDVYKEAPLLTKLNLLMEVQSRRADAQAIAATERWSENAEAERHWGNEHRLASAKATWLFEGLKKALKAQEPAEPVLDVDTWKCGNCGHTLEHQQLLGDNVLFHEKYNYCPECGKAVKWE